MLEIGAEAPPFSVLDHHGETVRLTGLRGQKVLLWFYPRADTPG
jgi:peroxiredoxin Q/BCP